MNQFSKESIDDPDFLESEIKIDLDKLETGIKQIK